MESAWDIVIVGGGPAGLATALHLQQQAPDLAARAVILEAATHPRRKLCGGGVTFHGEAQLARLGLRVDVPAVQVHALHFRLGPRAFVTHCRDAMRVIQRAEWDGALAEAVAARGLAVRSDERLLDLRPCDGGIELHTTRATLRARAVVGADGTASTVRQKLGLRGTHGVARLLHTMTPLDGATRPDWQAGMARFDFSCLLSGVQGYEWEFPCLLDGQPFVNRGIFDSRIAPDGGSPPERGRLKRVFADGLAARGLAPDAARLEGHPVRWFNPRAEFARPHALLAGDAAGVDPLFAEGISYAMEYGAVVAETLRDAFARGDFGFATYRDRLLRHPLGAMLQRRAAVARALYAFRQPPLWALLWRLAAIAPALAKHAVGAALGVLPPRRR